jgi:hypothetical protein
MIRIKNIFSRNMISEQQIQECAELRNKFLESIFYRKIHFRINKCQK